VWGWLAGAHAALQRAKEWTMVALQRLKAGRPAGAGRGRCLGLMALAAVLTIGCGAPPDAAPTRTPDAIDIQAIAASPPAPVEPSSTALPGMEIASPAVGAPGPRIADETQNGGTLTLVRGEQLRVVLHSTYWEFAPVSDDRVLRLVAGPTGAAGGGCVPGGGCGTVTATYQAVATGSATITASRRLCGEALRCRPDQASFILSVVVS
jgi:hypothetical protein